MPDKWLWAFAILAPLTLVVAWVLLPDAYDWLASRRVSRRCPDCGGQFGLCWWDRRRPVHGDLVHAFVKTNNPIRTGHTGRH